MRKCGKKSLHTPRKISNIPTVRKIQNLLRKYLFTGLLVLLPIWATYYVLRALLEVIDGILAGVPAYFLGYKIPGLGIITLILLLLFCGMLFANYVGATVVRWSDELLRKVPLVRGVYFTVKQIMETFSLKHQFHGVGLVEYPRKGCYSVGFMTGEIQGDAIGQEGKFISVFVPTTPNPTAGFLLILPTDEVTRLDMTVDEGMKFIISLGLVPMSELQAAKLKHHPRETA